MSEGRQSIVRLLEGVTAFFLLLEAVLRPLAAGNLWREGESVSRLGDTIYVALPVWLALVFWLFRAIAVGRLLVFRTGADLLLVPLILLVLLSPRPPANLNAALPSAMVWATNILYLYLVVNVGREAGFARWVLAALLSTTVAVTVYGAIQAAVDIPAMQQAIASDPKALEEDPNVRRDPETLQELRYRAESARPHATFINENSLSTFLVLSLFPLLDLLLDAERGNWRQSVRSVLLIGILVLLALTRSKGGFVALAVGLYAFLWAARVGWFSRAAFRWGSAVVALLGVAALVALSFTPIDPLHVRQRDSSAGIRLGYWTGAIRVFLVHPWMGVGLENFESHYYEWKDAEADEVYLAHNDYLQVAADLGVAGLAAFVGFWALVLLRCLRARARDAEPPPRPRRSTCGSRRSCSAASARACWVPSSRRGSATASSTPSRRRGRPSRSRVERLSGR